MTLKLTRQSATRCLLLISILLCTGYQMQANDCPYVMPIDNEQMAQYRVHLQFRDASFDGICVVKVIDNEIKGIIVNDFGVRAFGFTVSLNRKKVKLHDVMPMINHWYVKRVIKQDLKVLFNATTCDESKQKKNSTYLIADKEGQIKLINSKRKIEYIFVKDNIEPQSDSIEEDETTE